MIRVEIISPNRSALKPFVRLPFEIYEQDARWAPPLVSQQLSTLCGPKHNELFAQGDQRFFIAYQDEKPVARVLAGVDFRFNARLNVKQGYISLFESYDNVDYAKAVLDAACSYLRQQGMERVVGPNAHSLQEMSKGILVDGFDEPPAFMTPYNPPYYQTLLEAAGFSPHREHYAYGFMLDDFKAEQLEAIMPRAQKRFGFRVESVVFGRQNEGRLVSDISRVIAETVPLGNEQGALHDMNIRTALRHYKPLCRPELTLMAYADERPVGFALAFPDYNEFLRRTRGHLQPARLPYRMRGISRARCALECVVPEFANRAVGSILSYHIYQGARKLGMASVEASAVDAHNVQTILTIERIGGRKSKTFRQYEKALVSGASQPGEPMREYYS